MSLQKLRITLGLLSCMPILVCAESYSTDIDVLYSEPGYLQLNPEISLMPGESITFAISGRVDVNHEHFEVRRCKYFGLKCWYEPRSVPHFRGANEFAVTLLLTAPDGSFEAKFERPANSNDPITISYPLTSNTSLTSPARLTGKIDIAGMVRAPCKNRPRYCSAGSLKLSSVGSNVNARRDRVQRELADNVRSLDPILVRSEKFIDPLLTDSNIRRKQMQSVFAEELHKANPSNSEQTFARSLVDIAKFAIGLHEDPAQVTKLNNVILEAYVVLGDWSRIKDEGGRSLDTAKSQCSLSPPPDNIGSPTDGCQAYAKMLKLNAVGWLEQKARYSSTEIRVALGFLEQAIAALGKEKLQVEANCRANKSACDLLGELFVDGARMLTVIRTSAELRKAEQWLTEALAIQQTIDKANST